jgi:hypothetical protein
MKQPRQPVLFTRLREIFRFESNWQFFISVSPLDALFMAYSRRCGDRLIWPATAVTLVAPTGAIMANPLALRLSPMRKQ